MSDYKIVDGMKIYAPTPTDKSPRPFDLKQADEIAKEYSEPNSMIDNGNLFFALCEYQEAYLAVKHELEAALLEVECIAHSWQDCLNKLADANKKIEILQKCKQNEPHLEDAAREWLKNGDEMDPDYASQVEDYIAELEKQNKRETHVEK